MRNIVIGILFLLAAILFLTVNDVSAGNLNQFDRDVFGNTYILDNNGRRDGKIEINSQGQRVILNRYGIEIGKLENDHMGNHVVVYTN